jgi:phosphoesterase RecJ-like protein
VRQDKRQAVAKWQDIIRLIETDQSFLITSHINPDCDALGSELALAEHLVNLGKEVTVINSDAVPPAYRFLDPQQKVNRYSRKKHAAVIDEARVIFVLDASGGWERLGAIGKALRDSQATKICIDHHPDASSFVDVAVIDTDAAATAELIYDLILAMEGSLSHLMAQALYAGIMTDTGSFRFPKTSSQTHCITAKLLAAGADPLTIYRQIYEQYSVGLVKLKGHVLESIKTTANGQLAYYSLTRETLDGYGVKSAELDGFASLGQQIGGVRVVIFCTEATNKRVKFSLRSDGTIAINQIAREYKGGGHPSAAGALVPGQLEDVMAELVQKVSVLLEPASKAGNQA